MILVAPLDGRPTYNGYPTAVPYARFDISTSFNQLELCFWVFYIGRAAEEFVQLFNQRGAYFKRGWNQLDVLLFLCNLGAFVLRIYGWVIDEESSNTQMEMYETGGLPDTLAATNSTSAPVQRAALDMQVPPYMRAPIQAHSHAHHTHMQALCAHIMNHECTGACRT